MRFSAGLDYPAAVAGFLVLLAGAVAPGLAAEPVMPGPAPASGVAADGDPAYRPALDSRGREVEPADLPEVAPGVPVEVERILIPLRPPAGPGRIELELEVPVQAGSR